MMSDLKNSTAIWIKGWLFLLLGLFSAILLIFHGLTTIQLMLLPIAIWSFCRFYYFAFYVIEHYVDPSYKFSGLTDFARYALTRRESHRQ